MRKFSDDHIYQTLALVAIVACWGSMWWTSSSDYQLQFAVSNTLMEQGLIFEKSKIEKGKQQFIVEVYKDGNTRADLAALKRDKQLMYKTNQVMAKIDSLKNHLKKHQDVYGLMIKQKKAAQFNQWLNTYAQWITNEFKDLDIPTIALRGSKNNIDHFRQATIIGAISFLTTKQVDIRYIESEVARKLRITTRISCSWLFPNVQAVAQAKQIQIGDTYTADLFISDWFRIVRPRMTSQGQTIPVKENKTDISIVTQQPGKFYWIGKITHETLRAKDITIVHKTPYEVLPK